MSGYSELPSVPGYVSIKEAARILGISEKTVYFYIDQKRLPARRAADVMLISLDDLKNSQLRPAGRPRKTIPPWRSSSGKNNQFIVSIQVQVIPGMEGALLEKLENIRNKNTHTFPGTVARSVSMSETHAGQVLIVLIWRESMIPDKESRRGALEALKRDLTDVLDWDTARYDYSMVILHT